MNQHWNMQRGIVNEESVRFLSVLAKALAVISAEHDESVAIEALGLQERNQTPDLCIGERNFTIVEVLLIFLAIRCGWAIRIVRVVQMHPEEKLALGVLGEPV